MKKYMQTAGNPVPFQEVVEMTEAKWDEIAKQGDLTPYIGKTVTLIEKGEAAYYVLDDKRYVKFTISELEG